MEWNRFPLHALTKSHISANHSYSYSKHTHTHICYSDRIISLLRTCPHNSAALVVEIQLDIYYMWRQSSRASVEVKNERTIPTILNAHPLLPPVHQSPQSPAFVSKVST